VQAVIPLAACTTDLATVILKGDSDASVPQALQNHNLPWWTSEPALPSRIPVGRSSYAGHGGMESGNLDVLMNGRIENEWLCCNSLAKLARSSMYATYLKSCGHNRLLSFLVFFIAQHVSRCFRPYIVTHIELLKNNDINISAAAANVLTKFAKHGKGFILLGSAFADMGL